MSWLKCRVQDSCHACALGISERIRAQIVSMDGVEATRNLQGNVLIIGLGWVGVDACRAPVAHGAKISIIDVDPEVIRAVTPCGFVK